MPDPEESKGGEKPKNTGARSGVGFVLHSNQKDDGLLGKRVELVLKLLDATVFTVNEVRKGLGLEDVDWGDKDPSTLTLKDKSWWMVNEKRKADHLPEVDGGNVIYLPSDEIPAIEEEEKGKGE